MVAVKYMPAKELGQPIWKGQLYSLTSSQVGGKTSEDQNVFWIIQILSLLIKSLPVGNPKLLYTFEAFFFSILLLVENFLHGIGPCIHTGG